MSKVKKVILFYNPNSGSGMFKNNLDYIIGRYQREGYLVVPIRAAHGHVIFDYLAELDQATYREEYRQIIAAGGDGTINVCVNAMIRNNIDLPIAILPAGTANDFASYFDLPSDFDKLLDIALDDCCTYADVGKVNDQYFVNMAVVGQGLGISKSTGETLKTIFGLLAYYLKILLEIPQMRSREVTLTTPERVYREKMFFMIIMNGESVSGLKKMSPDSKVNDGLFDVLLFRSVSPWKVPAMFFGMLRGSHLDSGKVLQFRTDRLKVDCETELPVDVDGEGGAAVPLTFSVLPKKLKIHIRREKTGEDGL